MVIPLTLLILGVIVLFVGYVLFLVDAFRVSVGWGLAVFLIPGAALVFMFMHWSAAKRGFLTQLAGLAPMLGAVLLLPKTPAEAGEEGGFASSFKAPFEAVALAAKKAQGNSEMTDAVTDAKLAADPTPTPPPPPSPELLQAKWDANRRSFTELQKKYESLNARRTTLPVADPDAVRDFNRAVSEYAEGLKQAQAEKAELLKLGPSPE